MTSNDKSVEYAQRDLRHINKRRSVLRSLLKTADMKAESALAVIAECSHRVQPNAGRPRGTTLCMEIAYSHPAARCRMKPPHSWEGHDPNGARWLLSGGDPLVFGECNNECPLLKSQELDRDN